MRNIVPNLVYAATGHEVRLVMVDGRVLVRDSQVLTMDAVTICAEAQEQAMIVSGNVAGDPVHRNMALLDAMEDGRL